MSGVESCRACMYGSRFITIQWGLNNNQHPCFKRSFLLWSYSGPLFACLLFQAFYVRTLHLNSTPLNPESGTATRQADITCPEGVVSRQQEGSEDFNFSAR